MKARKKIALFLIAAMCFGLFAACSSPAPSEAAPTDGSISAATPADATAAESAAVAGGTGKKLIAAFVGRTMGNAYEVQLGEGVEMFAEYVRSNGVDVEVQVLPCDFNSEKQINDINALVAKKDDNTDVIFVVMANENPLVAEIADICDKAGVYWANLWNLPEEGLDASNYDYWVLHSTPDDYIGGQQISESLFHSFGDSGRICAIQGLISTTSSILRYKGLEDTLPNYPDVELLDTQAGDFDPQKAMTIAETWLAKYDDLDAIWCANDDMAVGVISALKNAGKNGEITVCGVDGTPDMLEAIQAGDADSTIDAMPLLQAGYSLAYCYAALNGEIDPSSMDKTEKMVYTRSALVNQENIEEYMVQEQAFDFSDLSYPIIGSMD